MSEIDKHVFTENTPAILIDLSRIVSQVAIKSMDMQEDQAKQLGIDVAQEVAKSWGGLSTYIPVNVTFNISKRDMEIWEKFNGRNHHQLAKEYGISTQWVYSIVKRVYKKLRQENQLDLFNSPKKS